MKQRIAADLPELDSYFQSGGLVDAVLNMGMPAPIDVQVAGSDLQAAFDTAQKLAAQIRMIRGVADAYIPRIWTIRRSSWISTGPVPASSG